MFDVFFTFKHYIKITYILASSSSTNVVTVVGSFSPVRLHLSNGEDSDVAFKRIGGISNRLQRRRHQHSDREYSSPRVKK